MYHSVVPLFNEKDEMLLFPIYKDEDIGISTEWRGHLTLQVLYFNLNINLNRSLTTIKKLMMKLETSQFFNH